jgi:hypothetical protein
MIGALGSLSATPGIHLTHLMSQMNAEGANSAALAAHQRNYFSQIQQSSNSTNARFDMYRLPHNDPSGRAQTASGGQGDASAMAGSALLAAQ